MRLWLALAMGLFLPASGFAATAQTVRCQEMVAKAARRYVVQLHRAHLRCADAEAAGGTCNQDALDGSEFRAAAGLQSRIARRCTSVLLGELGFPAQCSDPDGPPFTPADAAACMRSTHRARVQTMTAVEYPGAPGTLSGGTLDCQEAIGSTGRRFVNLHLRGRQVCRNRQLRGRLSETTVDCYDDGAPRTSGDTRTDRRLGRASTRLVAQITARCGGIALENLGFPGSCSDPDGAPFSVGDLTTCLDATHGLLVNAMVGIEYAVGGPQPTTTSTTVPGGTTTTSTTLPGATTTTSSTSTTSTTFPSFETLADVVGPSGDADGDGWDNTAEMAACSNPADPASTPENDDSFCLNNTIYSDTLGPAWGNSDRFGEPSYQAAVALLAANNAAECGLYCSTTPNMGSPSACAGQWPHTGEPEQAFYADGETLEVSFPDEDGNMLNGRIYLPPGVVCEPDGEPVCDGVTDAVVCTDAQARTFPAVVICPGFIGNQPMHNWAAHRMAKGGYITMTFDPSGQGRSQGQFPNPDDDLSSEVNDASPFSRDIGTAMNFVVSGANPVRDLIEIDPLLIVNQGLGDDHTEPYVLGTAGHSFGARGSITYQQSTETAVYPVRTRAVVGWSHFDNPGTIGNVPIQLHSGDEDAGFVQPPGSGNIAPEMERRYDRLGNELGPPNFTPQDRQIVMMADATHISWSQGPYFYYPTWAEEVAYHYTLAWFDKYLRSDVSRQMSGVTGNMIDSVDEFTDYDECTSGGDCFTATERLKMVHPRLSDTWCSRYDIGGDVSTDMKGDGCQTEEP